MADKGKQATSERAAGTALRSVAIAEVSLPVVHGAVALPTAPGIGVALPDDLITHFRVG